MSSRLAAAAGALTALAAAYRAGRWRQLRRDVDLVAGVVDVAVRRGRRP